MSWRDACRCEKPVAARLRQGRIGAYKDVSAVVEATEAAGLAEDCEVKTMQSAHQGLKAASLGVAPGRLPNAASAPSRRSGWEGCQPHFS